MAVSPEPAGYDAARAGTTAVSGVLARVAPRSVWYKFRTRWFDTAGSANGLAIAKPLP